MTPRQVPAWPLYAVILLLPMALLASFRHAGFVADDFLFAATPSPGVFDIVSSPWAHPLGLTVAYRPITALSYHINQTLFGHGPTGFHLFNDLVHGINAALLALIVRRLTDSTLSAVVAGIAFVLHPVTHESVIWISGRTYPLASLFSLTAIAWMLQRANMRPRLSDHLVLASLFVGALLNYEAALTLPLLLMPVVVTRGGGGRSLLWLTPWLALLAYLAVRYAVLTTPADDFWLHLSRPEAEFGSASMFERLRVNGIAAASRLLAAGIGRTPSQSTTFIVTLVTGLVLAWAIVRQPASWRTAAIAVAIIVVAFVPFTTYIGFADRFAYLSAAGVAMFIGTGAAAVSLRPRMRVVAGALLTVTLMLWGRQYVLAGRDWVAAGQVAQDLLTDLHTAVPSPPPGARLHFLDVPYRYGAALVYITHLDRAVNLSYGRDDLVISTGVSTAPLPAGRPTILRWAPPASASERGRLRLVDMEEARTSRDVTQPLNGNRVDAGRASSPCAGRVEERSDPVRRSRATVLDSPYVADEHRSQW